MLTKDQNEIVKLKYAAIINTFQSELILWVHNRTYDRHAKIDQHRLSEVANKFYDYIDSITE